MLLSLTMGFCMIKVKNFSQSYGDFEAVKDLSFGVGTGDILGLVGANGAGKSTTLRVLSGIIGPTSGSLAIAGHDIVNQEGGNVTYGYKPDVEIMLDDSFQDFQKVIPLVQLDLLIEKGELGNAEFCFVCDLVSDLGWQPGNDAILSGSIGYVL